jgi:hypothetical protein
MATQIVTWEIVGGNLQNVNKRLSETGRKEKDDLEAWIKTNPEILGRNIVLIGQQVMTKSGPLDFLGIDELGNIVIVELKRDKLPRESVAQAIDYASDLSTWSVERLSEICQSYKTMSLQDTMTSSFPNISIEDITINDNQRLLLVGFGMDEALTRMIDWMAEKTDVSINVVLLSYVKTSNGAELLSRIMVLPEETEKEKTKSKKFTIQMSDEPGNYTEEELIQKLHKYLSSDLWSAKRMSLAIFPALLAGGVMTREQLLKELVSKADAEDIGQAGQFFSLISKEIGHAKNDFLRQVINYKYPRYEWEKDNFSIAL